MAVYKFDSLHMLEEFNFRNPQLVRRDEIVSKLKEKDTGGRYRGAVVFEDYSDSVTMMPVIHVGNPYSEHPIITTIPTRASAEEIEFIREHTTWMEETCQMLEFAACAYQRRITCGIVGPSAIGKTFAIRLLTKMVYGLTAEPVKETINENTDVSSLSSKYVPNVTDRGEEFVRTLDGILSTEFGRSEADALQKTIEDTEGLDPVVRQRIVMERARRLAELAVDSTGNVKYRLEFGVIPKVFTGEMNHEGFVEVNPEKPGRGVIGLIDEVNRGKDDVTNFFLMIRGDGRHLVDSYQDHTANGITVFRGPDSWICFTMNPVGEDFEGVHPLDPALARGITWLSMDDLSAESYELAAFDAMTFKRSGAPKPLIGTVPFEFFKEPDIASICAQRLADYHRLYKSEVAKYEKNQEQKIPVTLDDMATFCEMMYCSQFISDTGRVDLAETMRRACEFAYLRRPGLKKNNVTMLRNAFEVLLTDAQMGQISYKNQNFKCDELLEILVDEASSSMQERLSSAAAEINSTVRGFVTDVDVPLEAKLRVANSMEILVNRLQGAAT